MRISNGIDWAKAKMALLRIGMGAMAQSAEYMAQRAVDYAPVDTGFLSYNIKVFVNTNDVTAQVVSMAYYSAYVEFGHLTPGGTWVAPRPFMRMAMADTIREFPEIVKRYNVMAPYHAGSPGDNLTANLSAY